MTWIALARSRAHISIPIQKFKIKFKFKLSAPDAYLNKCTPSEPILVFFGPTLGFDGIFVMFAVTTRCGDVRSDVSSDVTTLPWRCTPAWVRYIMFIRSIILYQIMKKCVVLFIIDYVRQSCVEFYCISDDHVLVPIKNKILWNIW